MSSAGTDSYGKPISNFVFYLNNVIVMCYKSDGSRDWEATISKNQTFKTKDQAPALRWDSYTCGQLL